MWAAASGDCHLLQWLEARAERLPPMRVYDEQISGRATVRTGCGSVAQHIAVVGHPLHESTSQSGSTIREHSQELQK